ncbi:MAG TPA: tetratricopeptide repeat protein [Verrucomicrobiae bacterium]|nr:tetratricopeptide repeat protein [Verrucomicrobiae bacterium]
MNFLVRTFLLLMCGALAVPQIRAASSAENQAFATAEKVYFDGDYKNAEIDFRTFIQKFPGSARIPEAVLYEAQARIKLGDFAAALKLLAERQAEAGALADWYLLCQGEALLAKGDFAHAETNFIKLDREFPGSSHRLAAVVNAALACMRQSKWPQVSELLGRTNGIFKLTAVTNHASPEVIRGFLLLSEAQLSQGDAGAAEQSLQQLSASPLDPTNNWQRQYLLCRVLQTAGRLEDALQNTTNLLVLAEATGQPSFQAQSRAFEAALLERLGRPEEAIAAYRQNLAAGIPEQEQREALLKITQLSLATGKVPEAVQVLQSYLNQFPTNECSDLALLTLGELRLRQYQPGGMTNLVELAATNAPGATNFLEQAIVAFRNLTNTFPKSRLIGKAHLDLGWCYWLAGENMADARLLSLSQTSFQDAVALLPRSFDQAQAYFKLADAQYQLTNFAAAISNYSTVAERFHDLSEVETNLAEPALYQIVRAGLAAPDERSETNALAKIMGSFPNGAFTRRAVFLVSQQMGPGFAAAARGLFNEAARGATGSPLLAEIELAIARTYEEEGQWDQAALRYDAWLAAFSNNPARPRAEYFQAMANYNAGNETNALLQFTNLISRFPTNEYAPLAQWWVADYFYRAGNFVDAEINYKFVYQNYGSSSLAYPARMMAGRMAVQRQDWQNAPGYFLSLANDKNCPADLQAQALDAYGDTFLMQNSSNKLGDYREAFKTFELICRTYPTNPVATLAWGQKAICLLQFAGTNTQDFAPVTNAFQQVLDSPLANATARSIAEVGLGFTFEKIADTRAETEKPELLNAALRHYERVLYGTDNGFLREGESADPFWTRKAGQEAERLAERLQNREYAIGVYRRLQQMFPYLRFEDKIKALQAQR